MALFINQHAGATFTVGRAFRVKHAHLHQSLLLALGILELLLKLLKHDVNLYGCGTSVSFQACFGTCNWCHYACRLTQIICFGGL